MASKQYQLSKPFRCRELVVRLEEGCVDAWSDMPALSGCANVSYACFTSSQTFSDSQVLINTFSDRVLQVDSYVSPQESLADNVQQEAEALEAKMISLSGTHLYEHIKESLMWAAEDHVVEQLALDASEAQRCSQLLQPLNKKMRNNMAVQGLSVFERHDRYLGFINEYQ
ncbi:hypothetical protein [Halomonas halocynthiae]|uniref:hypothetical protein n=1 Tax=Halomonas halocynthiae TaxID=176290 RepID=UPI0004210EA8|nr:hypothetical protein [Halomonas halocynthiae]